MTLAQSDSEKDAPPKIKILLVTGGCCHDYSTQKNLIKKGLESRCHCEVTVVQQGGTRTDSMIELYKDPDWAKPYDLVIHDECFADAKDPKWVQGILQPHLDGKPALVIHCAMHCYRDGTENWFEFCGVTSRRHGSHYGHEVLNRAADHPIMKGFGAGWANPKGELYWIEKVWPNTTALASAKNREKGNEEVCVWTNEYGPKKTRVFGTTLGHHNETVQSNEFLNLITRGSLWAVDKLEDKYLKKQVPSFVPENIALNKTATASATQEGNWAKHATDGDPNTRWCALGAQAGFKLNIDLGKNEKIAGAEIMWEFDHPNYRYKLKASKDKKEWLTVVDQSKNKSKLDEHKFKFKTEARYFEMEYFGSDNSGAWCSLWELKLFGEKMVKIDPAKSSLAAIKAKEQKLIKELNLPDGFEATLFAEPPAVLYPVFVAAAPDGVTYVAVDKNGSLDRKPRHGAIYRLRDIDGDGRADETKLFVDNVDSPRGLVWDHDRLYVMHPPHLSAFIDSDGDGFSDRQEVLVKNIAFTFKDRPADHTSNGVTLGIDGWLYLAIGDFGFMKAEGADGRELQFRGGGVVRVRPDGSNLEVYSYGTRNILEVGMDPLLNGFVRDNTNDGGGWDIRMHHFSGLEHHGYPSLYMNFGEEIVQPLADYGGGSGCGSLYMDEPGFPAGFGNAMYTCDWGRQKIFRHHLTRKGATFVDKQSDFVNLNRVTDLDVDANSRMYLTSWKGASFTYVGENVGYMIQLRPKNFKPDPLPDFPNATDDQLIDVLSSKSHRRRLEAQRTLIRRYKEEAAREEPGDKLYELFAKLFKLAQNSESAKATRVATVYAIAQIFESQSHQYLSALAEKDPSIAAIVIRALGEPTHLDGYTVIPSKAIELGLKSDDARTKLESIQCVARGKMTEHSELLAKLMTDSDPVISHTAIRAMTMIGDHETCLKMIEQTGNETSRKAALRAIQTMHTLPAAKGLLKLLEKENDSARKLGLVTALSRIHFKDGEWKGNSWGTRPDTSGPYYQPATWQASKEIADALALAFETSEGKQISEMLDVFSKHKIRFGGMVDIVLAKANSDSSLTTKAVSFIAKEKSLSQGTLKFMLNAAKNSKLDQKTRDEATAAIIRSPVAPLDSVLEMISSQYTDNVPRDIKRNFMARNFLQRNGKLLLTKLDNTSIGKNELFATAVAHMAFSKNGNGGLNKPARARIEQLWQNDIYRKKLVQIVDRDNLVLPKSKVIALSVDADKETRALGKKLSKKYGYAMAKGDPIAKLKPNDVLAKVIKEKGDTEVGSQLFNTLNCAKCHTIDPTQKLRGPYLPNVVKTYKRDQLAESILLPNKTIAQGFATNIIETFDGKSYSGFVTAEAADSVTIRDNAGQEITIKKEDIEDRSETKISSMPEGLLNDITPAQFSSLLDYLQTLKDKSKE